MTEIQKVKGKKLDIKFSPELIEETFKFAATMMNDENLLYHNTDEACEYLDISKKDLNKLYTSMGIDID